MADALALFDLDFTLIPFDSGLRWARFMVGEGVLAPGTDEAYLDVCRGYVAGRTSIEALQRFAAQHLLAIAPEDVPALQARFEAAIRAELPAASCSLVARHQQAGDLCCIVTTTNEIVARPFARAFGIAHLLGSQPVFENGRFTGEYTGPLCHGATKVERVEAWLRGRAVDPPAARFRRRVFYSDSRSDLPLLEWVDAPIVVRPDPGLRAHAEACGWPIIERLD
ncbi:HAD-IB family hydrolase [Thauera sp.]|uniref:HAD family hydrolase n=1 Tax=Thauera sp. TaxID=1905334 RepID=UPI002A36200F|nr:HAD-IB family hydrolase [Thauera sp.]MDX9887153.1 HAD-IB family hydrolase [Thauera sp.]